MGPRGLGASGVPPPQPPSNRRARERRSVVGRVGGGGCTCGVGVGEPDRSEFRCWRLRLYVDAAAAGGSYSGPHRVGTTRRTADPERSALEAARRARGQIRRYCASNRLNRLGTLTYAGDGCHDPRQFRRDVGGFFRRMRRDLGGEAFPYLRVPEWHPGGHGLHGHFAVGRYVPHTLIREAWGRGRVHIKLLGDLPVGSGALEEARLAAGYRRSSSGGRSGPRGSRPPPEREPEATHRGQTSCSSHVGHTSLRRGLPELGLAREGRPASSGDVPGGIDHRATGLPRTRRALRRAARPRSCARARS